MSLICSPVRQLKKGGVFEIGRVAGRGRELTEFFQGEEFASAVNGIDGFEVVVDVFLQEFLLISDFEEAAEGDVDVAHLALAAAVVAKVVVNANPFLVFGVQFGFEVDEEVHLQLGLVQEIVLAADDGEFSLGQDGFGLGYVFFVGVLVALELRLVCEVYSQVFIPDVLSGVRVSEGRVEVQIEGLSCRLAAAAFEVLL